LQAAPLGAQEGPLRLRVVLVGGDLRGDGFELAFCAAQGRFGGVDRGFGGRDRGVDLGDRAVGAQQLGQGALCLGQGGLGAFDRVAGLFAGRVDSAAQFGS
jgi:hypothetical protein